MAVFISIERLKDNLCTLDYKKQYKACYAFYDEIIKYPQFDENNHCLRFDEIYESINGKRPF